MKKAVLSLGIWALLLVTPGMAKADISVDFFYNNLSGGSWVEVADYGYCWQPDVAVGNSNWRPYADGYWAYTDLGWTWISYEDFGWATYHYGRWALLSDYGWVWVPGRDADLEWGPAWVSWRTGGEYVGWAPLPPETIAVVESRPLTGHLDVEFNIGPAYYNFVDVRYIGEPVLRERIIAPTQNITYIEQTVNVTNITYKNKTVYNYGPDINVINRTSARPIQRLRLDREQNVDVATAARSGGLTKVQGDRLLVAAPMRVTRSAGQAAPPAVKTKVAAAKIDRGWAGVGDEKAQADFKQRIKAQDLKKVPPPTAGGAASQADANAGAYPNADAAAGASTGGGQGPGQGRHGQHPGAVTSAASPAPTPATGVSPGQAGGNETAGTGGRGGQGRKNRFPQEGQNAVPGAGTAAGAAVNAAGDNGTAQGEGHHGQGPQQFHNVTPPPGPGPNAATAAGDQSQQGTGERPRRRLLRNNPPGPGVGQGAEGQGAQGQGQGGGGQHQHERGQGTGPGAEGEHHPQGQGEGQGHHGEKKGQPAGSPAPTPQ